MSYGPSETITDVFYHGTTGKVDGDFTKRLYKNGESSSVTVTVTEISNGYYKATFTPDAEGLWALALEEGGLKWEDSYLVETAVVDEVVETNSSVTLKEALSVVLAATAGVTENSQKIFKDPSGTNTRIQAVLSDTDRTAIVLTPSS